MQPGNLSRTIQRELNTYRLVRKANRKADNIETSRFFCQRLADLFEFAEAFHLGADTIPQEIRREQCLRFGSQ